MLRRTAFLLIVTFGRGASSLAAQDLGLEIGLRLGLSRPAFDSSFTNPAAGPFVLPDRVLVARGGDFSLNADDGGAIGFAAGFRPIANAFIELRYDRASVTFDNTAVPSQFDGADSDLLNIAAEGLEEVKTVVDFRRTQVWSANAGVRYGDRIEGSISGGVSRLSKVGFSVVQRVLVPNFDIRTILILPYTAQAPSEGEYGWNVGAAVSVRLSKAAYLGFEGRLFRFDKRTFPWGPIPYTPLGFQQDALDRLNRGPEPVVLDPSFQTYVAYLSLRL